MVGLFNPTREVIAIATDRWHVENLEWPGKYFYWIHFTKAEGQGGMSADVVCGCADGPCPEPCGGPAKDLVLAPGERREWRIPFEVENAAGVHTLTLGLEWRDHLAGRSADLRKYERDFQMIVGDAQGGCAMVHLTGPPNKALNPS